MKALYDAIFVKWAASSLPSLLTVLYNTRADDNAEFPYGVVQVVNGVTGDFATDEHYSDIWLIQFNLFQRGSNMTDLLVAFAALIDTFDSATLAVSGYKFLSCRREGVLQTEEEGVWQINVTYRIKVRAI